MKAESEEKVLRRKTSIVAKSGRVRAGLSFVIFPKLIQRVSHEWVIKFYLISYEVSQGRRNEPLTKQNTNKACAAALYPMSNHLDDKL